MFEYLSYTICTYIYICISKDNDNLKRFAGFMALIMVALLTESKKNRTRRGRGFYILVRLTKRK